VHICYCVWSLNIVAYNGDEDQQGPFRLHTTPCLVELTDVNKKKSANEVFTSKGLFGSEGQDSTCPLKYQGISYQAV
jgi:hypothetical protein